MTETVTRTDNQPNRHTPVEPPLWRHLQALSGEARSLAEKSREKAGQARLGTLALSGDVSDAVKKHEARWDEADFSAKIIDKLAGITYEATRHYPESMPKKGLRLDVSTKASDGRKGPRYGLTLKPATGGGMEMRATRDEFEFDNRYFISSEGLVSVYVRNEETRRLQRKPIVSEDAHHDLSRYLDELGLAVENHISSRSSVVSLDPGAGRAPLEPSGTVW